MDPPSDPPPPPPLHLPNSTPSPSPHHPSYEEMITAAILGLNDQNGSNRRAISKFIETHYSNLPPTHSALLTHCLKRLKLNGHLLMVKHSYHLPRSTTAPNGSLTLNPLPSDPISPTSKRRPGRPPKPRPDAVQPPVPVFAPSVDMNALPDVVPVASAPVIDAPSPALPVRGRGRPPKHSGSKRGRPRKTGGSTPAVGTTGRGRGRPRKNAPAPSLSIKEKGQGRPRGRPRKSVNLFQGLPPGVPVVGGIDPAPASVGGIAPVAGKRRGRPPKAGVDAKKPRTFATGQQRKPRKKLSGKPLGRPRKNAEQSQDSQLLVAYLDLKAKLENLQSRVKQTAIVIKPYLHNETAINAVQELELVALSDIAPSDSQRPQPQQQQQPEQPQPQLQPPLPTYI